MGKSLLGFGMTMGILMAMEHAAAQTLDEDALAQVYGGKDFVTIATGDRQAVSRAPAIASVITAADIEAMGATNLSQALEAVPGLHVSVSANEYNPIYIIRGAYTEANSQTLMLVNGIPMTSVFTGGQGQAWGGMPVANIARIEVVRGPGSSLYGADAFAGVINVITKTSVDSDGLQFGMRAGSYDTYDGWLTYGDKLAGWDSAYSVQWHTTNGQKGVIDADAQTALDGVFATQASLAPGPVNTQYEALDAHLDLARDAWRVRLGYQGRYNVGTGAGIAQALDPQGSKDSDRINADLTYQKINIAPNLGVTAQLSYAQSSLTTHLILFPPGAFGNAFPEGMIGNPSRSERAVRLNTSALYTGFSRHKLRLGAGYENLALYKIEESKNFSNRNTPFPGTPPPVVDVSDSPDLVYTQPHDRRVVYGLFQDEWQLMPDWELTTGARYDYYSDFGGTLNPRLALVWQTTYRLTSKLLYGRAFRAPVFQELYIINNPVALGNRSLNPETIDTLELAFDYRSSNTTRASVSVYRYEMNNIIRIVPDPAPATTRTAQNFGKQRGMGLEGGIEWAIAKTLRVSGNYAYQQTQDLLTDSYVANVPHQQIYARADWAFRPAWNFNTQAKWVTDRQRAITDARPTIADYVIVDVTLRRKRLATHWEIAASVRNLFDADAREPSLAPGSIRNDLPLPGRNYYIELRFRR